MLKTTVLSLTHNGHAAEASLGSLAFGGAGRLMRDFNRVGDWIFPNGNVVVGHAALWGDVIEHEHGYRAQYGSVHNLMNVVGGKLDLEMLRGHYVAK